MRAIQHFNLPVLVRSLSQSNYLNDITVKSHVHYHGYLQDFRTISHFEHTIFRSNTKSRTLLDNVTSTSTLPSVSLRHEVILDFEYTSSRSIIKPIDVLNDIIASNSADYQVYL